MDLTYTATSQSEEKTNLLRYPCSVNYKKIVLVIPAYNEERFIGSVVLKARKYADTVLVIDDGSTDATAEVAAAAGAIVVRCEQNQGKGIALSTGFCKARELAPDVVVTIDGDGQHVPEEIETVAALVLEGKADVVVGSRYLEPTSQVPPHRIWGHHLFNFITNQMSGVSLTDSQSGFRAFSPRALRTLSFQSQGFSVESEMQFLVSEHKLKLTEAPITVYYHDKPKRPVIVHGLMVLNGILRLMGQYRPLLFYCIPGVFLLLAGLAWGLQVLNIYDTHSELAHAYFLISVMLFLVGALVLFAGFFLQTVRRIRLNRGRSGNFEIDPVGA
ncbi:MAG: glycosyltransferase family 2 protein [Anaerolineae bacterium]|nr:glycosyltransferase family 2 protein [Anaerolineae bacterium]